MKQVHPNLATWIPAWVPPPRRTEPPAMVARVTAAGYWWPSSTSFANPAITIARAMTDTFAGIRPVDTPGFIAAQFSGAIIAWLAGSWLFGRKAA